MPDTFEADAGQRIDAQGRVTYDFQGHVHAEGLDFDASNPGEPAATIQWLDQNGARVAHIVGWGGIPGGSGLQGVVNEATASSAAASLIARSQGNLARQASIDLTAAPTFQRVRVAAGAGGIRTLLDDLGQSDFVQTESGRVVMEGIYQIDTGIVDPGGDATADLEHDLGRPVIAFGGMHDIGFAFMFTWRFFNTSANNTQFWFHNHDTVNGAQGTLYVFLASVL